MIDDFPINKNLGLDRMLLDIRVPEADRDIYQFAFHLKRDHHYLLPPLIFSSFIFEFFLIEP